MTTRFSLRGTVVLVVVAAVAARHRRCGRRRPRPRRPVQRLASRHAGPTPGLQLPSSLPAGSHQVDGLPTGFPHDELGAVATAVSATRAQIGFDPDQAAAVAAVYADPAERAAFEDLARGAVATDAGRPAVGPTQEPPPPTRTPPPRWPTPSTRWPPTSTRFTFSAGSR